MLYEVAQYDMELEVLLSLITSFWAALLFFFGMRHPAIVDPNPLGGFRARLAVAALAIFILSFTAAPVR